MFAQRHDDRGQILPALAMLVVALVAGGLLLLQTGHATALRAEATTAADAAALAAAEELADQLRAALQTTGFNTATALDHGAARAAAEAFARRNGGVLRSISFDRLAVRVVVDSAGGLGDQGVPAATGRRATAQATATVEIEYAFGAPAAGGRSGAPLDAADLADVADRAGLDSVPSYSSLRNPAYYGSGFGGASINLLAPEMKASVAVLETLMGGPLIVSSGYRTAAYQASLCQRVRGPCAPPGRSMHQYGLAVDVANWAQTLPYLAQAGLCQPLPGNDAVHLSHATGRECGGRTGVLGPAGAFGGNPANYATFTVRLTD